MKQIGKRARQSGAVSLFVVIFAALLLTIVTVSFVQLMIKDQQQATASDLSQSAYDSAQAGVEDAKRLLLLDQSCKNNTAASTVNCTAIANALTPPAGQSETSCDTLARAGLVSETNGETLIEQSEGDTELDQAYTCVKIRVNTDDYKDTLEVNQSDIIPIRGVSAFDTIEISWFSRDDVSTETDNLTIELPYSDPGEASQVGNLPPVGTEWQFNTPPLMRAQLMQLGDGSPLTDFDNSQPGNRSNANTLFLYPSAAGLVEKDFALDARRSPTNTPQQVRCNASFVTAEFACKVTLRLPAPINGSNATRNAYLRLGALYNGAHYKVVLKSGNEEVKFNQVQPEVDSTGRANDMFRRVQARVMLQGDFTYPQAAIDMTGNLCKNFIITDQESGYQGATTCTP